MKQLIRTMKKSRLLSTITALTLTLALLLSTVAGLPIFATDDTINSDIVWDGGSRQPATKGTGTADDPYIIEKAEQLCFYLHRSSTHGYEDETHIKLATDIYLSAPGSFNTTSGAAMGTPNNWEAKAFHGTIDGDGHVIYGLYINENPTEYTDESHNAALISKPVTGGYVAIKNLGIDQSYINANGVAAAFVGTAGNSVGRVSFSKCYVGKNVTVIGRSAGALVSWGSFGKPTDGGSNYIVVDSCYSLATLEAHGKSAALVGSIWSGWYSIDKCYATHDIAGTAVSNSYSTTQSMSGVQLVADTDMQGPTALDTMENLGSNYIATETYPTLDVFFYNLPVDSNVWDGTTTTTPSGTGTEGDPYIIDTAAKFAWLMSVQKSGYAKLTEDIYLNDTDYINCADGTVTSGYKVRSWTPTTFNGTIDGDGHVIYGLYKNDAPAAYDTTSAYYGLITQPASGGSVTIKNLGIDNAYFDVNGSVAAFVGYSSSSTGRINISTSYVGKNVTIKGSAVGIGVAWGSFGKPADSGANYLVMDSCYSLATLVPNGYNACFYGGAWSDWWSVSKCYATHDIGYKGGLSNNYSTTQAVSGVAKVTDTEIRGANALDVMSNLGAAFVATDSYPILDVFVEKLPVADNVWTGDTAKPSGNGTEGDPYVIDTAAKFAWVMSVQKSGYAKLTADIYLNDVENEYINWQTGAVTAGYVPNTWTPTTFNGTIDGDGHVIYGLYKNDAPAAYDTTAAYYGLITQPASGGSVTIKNLGIDNAYFDVNGCVAAFVGYSSSSTGRVNISTSYVGKNVTIKGSAVGIAVAWGAFGKPADGGSNYLIVDSCYSLATLVPNGYNACFYGGAWSDWWSVSKCYATHDIGYKGGLSNNYSTTQAVSGVAKVADADILGANALDVMSNLGSNFVATANTYPAIKVFPYEPVPEEPKLPVADGVWSGETTQPSGAGTESDPYMITNAEEFAWVMSVQKSGYAKLTKDIYLNDLEYGYINWSTGALAEGFTPNTWVPDTFNGTIDGDGHVIYGLYINENPNEYTNDSNPVGLISKPNGTAIFKNIAIDNAFINVNGTVGAFAGVAGTSDGGRLEVYTSYVGANVTLKGAAVGAFVGWGNFGKPSSGNNYLVVDSCYSLATLTGVKYSTTCFYGAAWGGWFTINKSYATHDVGYAGISNCYSTTQNSNGVVPVADSAMKGAAALLNMSGLGSNFAAAKDTYPAITVFPYEPAEALDLSVWDGALSMAPEKGTGSEADPIIIENAAQFVFVMKNGGGAGKFYQLESDIFLNKEGEFVNQWTPNTFAGTIDGANHVIYGLYIDTNPASYTNENNPVGLITKPNGTAIFKNIAIDDAYINADGTVGAFAGVAGTRADDGGRLEVYNSYVGANVTLKGTSVGAFVGWGSFGKPSSGNNYLVVDSCYSLATLTGVKYTSTSFYGAAWGGWYTINKCYATHDIGSAGTSYCYSATQGTANSTSVAYVPAEKMKGGYALLYMYNLGENFVANKGTYPAIVGFPYEAADDVDLSVWDGGLVIPTTKGTGTSAEDAILIENAAQFVYVMQNGGAADTFYKLTTDIYLNEVGEFVNKWTSTTFVGTIDGDGHVIYGLYIDDGATQYTNDGNPVGLITKAAGDVTIKNLGIDNAYINANGTVAAFIGSAGSSIGRVKFSNSFVGENVTLIGAATGPFVAWGAYNAPAEGEENFLVIESCYSLATLTPQKHTSTNFYGASWGGFYTIFNSYATHAVADAGYVRDCYSGEKAFVDSNDVLCVAYINPVDMKGFDAINTMPGLVDGFIVTGGYPVLKAFNATFVEVVGAETSGSNIRFMMSYTGEQADGATVITVAGEEFTVVARGILVTGADNYSAKLIAGSTSAGVVEIRNEDLTDNWSFDAETGTTVYSVNIDGFDAAADYELSARGYIELSNGGVYYTDLINASVVALS